MNESSRAAARQGAAATATAFFIWGLFPLYFKSLHTLSAWQISAWRCVMACSLAFACLCWRGELGKARAALAASTVRWRLLCSASLLGSNWLLYIWGVGHGHVLTASLGYFINPLMNVLLGVLVLSERLNRLQWSAVAVAAGGVAVLTYESGELPWLALSLAATFSLYGLIRKTVAVESLPGLAVESLLALPLCVAYLVWNEVRDGGMQHYDWWVRSMLLLSGPLTAIPLLLFAFGARRISYATVGMLQYLSPTLQFACGVWVFHESLPPSRLACFAVIWLALLIYAADSLWRSRKLRVLG